MKKAEKKDNQLTAAIQRIKDTAKQNKITLSQAIEIGALALSEERHQEQIEFQREQNKMMKKMSGLFDLGEAKIKELIENMGKRNLDIDAEEIYARRHTPFLPGTAVHFYPSAKDKEVIGKDLNGAEYLPAMIVQMFGDGNFHSRKLNLVVFAYTGKTFSFGSVEPSSAAVGREISYWTSLDETAMKQRRSFNYAMAAE